ncbi:hypothetical protein [Halovivax sp.]|uniref:hypothetical protein n=1 Tax=Halovivax sp. TaxID=1935978 RepID=UPI0025B93CFC|nr:hypothetical protein [Halovivax sp.]
MDLDRLDLVAIGGILSIVALSPVLERPFLAAILAGFLLSVSTWRLYGGRPAESIAWLIWAGAAVTLVVVPPGPVAVAGVAVALLVGAALLFASRRARSLLAEAHAEPAE